MSDRAKTTILLVEDDSLLRKSLSRFISQRGYIALEAENGYEAMKVFREKRPDLVLTDLRMPVMDGFDLINELKATSPQTPVIIFSGVNQQETLDAVSLGACDYISKPVKNIGSLIERIEKALVRTQRSSKSSAVLSQTPGEIRGQTNESAPTIKAAATASLEKREWQTTVDLIEHPIGILQQNHVLAGANNSLLTALEKKRQEIVGKTCFLSSNGFDNRDQAASDFSEVFKGRDVRGRFSANNGLTYEITMRPYFAMDNETVAGCVYVAREMGKP